jgi:hypothetical protein
MTLVLGPNGQPVGRYKTTAFTFSGMPDTMLAGDVPPETPITLTIEAIEDPVDEFRRFVSQPQFNGWVKHGEFAAEWREARLIEPLPDRDYGNYKIRLVFQTQRQSLNITRPMGQHPHDPTEGWYRQLHSYSQALDQSRRNRLILAKDQQDLDKRCAAVDADDAELLAWRGRLWSSATPELIAGAEARGL